MLDNIIITGLEVLAVVQPEVVEGETQEVIWQLPAELGGAVQVVVLEEVLELEELPLGIVEEAVEAVGIGRRVEEVWSRRRRFRICLYNLRI